MLKTIKIITLAPTCFGSRRNRHQGAVLCLAKTAEYSFFVLVGIDAVNVMAAFTARGLTRTPAQQTDMIL
jgi:hypothetical protein